MKTRSTEHKQQDNKTTNKGEKNISTATANGLQSSIKQLAAQITIFFFNI